MHSKHAALMAMCAAYGVNMGPGFRTFTELPGHVLRDERLAADAQPQLVTTYNSGIPAYLALYQDPAMVEVLTAPMRAAEIIGEAKKGDWTTLTAQFPVLEVTGEVSSYDDFSNNGSSGANANFEFRQSYYEQTYTEWGERELDIMGLAKINWAQQQNKASALNLSKALNKMYFFGVRGLENYGLLNDPALYAPLTPSTKVAGGTSWDNATVEEIFGDVKTSIVNLIRRSKGLIRTDMEFTIALDPASEGNLTQTNIYGRSALDDIKKNYPKARILSAPEYDTAAGRLMQVICTEEIEGQTVGTCAFTEKMRAHAVVTGHSSWSQKKSNGGWGAILFHPWMIEQMLGI